jgi:hypothetical protein
MIFFWNYYKSSPLCFIVRGTKVLVRTNRMNAMIYVVQTVEA